MRKELRFILLSIVFSIWETLRNILRSSFSLSKLAKSVEADPWKQDSCLNCRKYTSYLVWKHCSHLHCEAFLCMVTDWLSAHFRWWEITRLVTSSLRVGASVDNCIKLPGPDRLMPPSPWQSVHCRLSRIFTWERVDSRELRVSIKTREAWGPISTTSTAAAATTTTAGLADIECWLILEYHRWFDLFILVLISRLEIIIPHLIQTLNPI